MGVLLLTLSRVEAILDILIYINFSSFLSRPETNKTYFKMPETEPTVVAEDVVDAEVKKVVAEAPAETEAAAAQTEANGTAEVVADGE